MISTEPSRRRHGRPRRHRPLARDTIGPARAPSPDGRSIRGGTAGTSQRPRGYPVDWPKTKMLGRQAGLKVSDFYEPGVFARALVAQATIKKWRLGGRASIDSLSKVAAGLTERLHWRVEWRDLVQADPISGPLAHRLIVLPLQTAPGGELHQNLVDGFRTSIVTRLMKLRGLQLVAPRADAGLTAGGLPDGDVTLQAVLREHGEQSRLDIDLTEVRTGIILWAESYTFSAADLLRAQTAIAAEVANQIGHALAAA